jgi:hypothetical protein
MAIGLQVVDPMAAPKPGSMCLPNPMKKGVVDLDSNRRQRLSRLEVSGIRVE